MRVDVLVAGSESQPSIWLASLLQRQKACREVTAYCVGVLIHVSTSDDALIVRSLNRVPSDDVLCSGLLRRQREVDWSSRGSSSQHR